MNEVIPTTELQQFSLMQAMSSLGYQLMRNPHGRHAFVNFNNMRIGKGVIAVSTAINLYNNTQQLNYFLGCDKYEVNQFRAAKIVSQIKLQYSSKKKGFINTSSHYVKFVDPAYENLFLIPHDAHGNE